PVYLVSANSQLPELKIIIAAYQDRLGFAPTLAEALGQLFGAPIGGEAAPVTPAARAAAAPAAQAPAASLAPAAGSAAMGDLARLIDQALQDYNAATEALRGGDFATYGQRIMELKGVLEEMRRLEVRSQE
ncbi:MAG: hypothetical protein ACK2U9_07280, partial [Anaerolineae bacterium]